MDETLDRLREEQRMRQQRTPLRSMSTSEA
jgi:hypothetical protein